MQSNIMKETKTLNIPVLQCIDAYPDLGEVSHAIEHQGAKTKISEVNWPDYNYKPEVILFIAHTKREILLKYRVIENHILARYTSIHSPVCRDSCVEFFISSINGFYYNFEFNCIGTPLVEYGKQGESRSFIDEEIISKIRILSTLGNKPIDTSKRDGKWELTVAIPFTLFNEDKFRKPYNHTYKANFYKCGEDLHLPHYLSWNRVDVDKPNFHTPDFFGEINFINSNSDCSTLLKN